MRKHAVNGGFFAYVYGTITVVLERYENLIIKSLYSLRDSFKGKYKYAVIKIDNKTDFPIGKGLSSSAAVCVTIARCFNSLFEIGMTIEEIMDVAFCGELLTGADCGRLAVRNGDAERLGQVFTEYQRLFDVHLIPACDELQAPRLHTVLNDDRVKQLSCGGKGVGSRGDGSVQLVCRNERERQELIRVLEDCLNCHAMPFSLRGSEYI
ncbi:GHMP kinase N-terminal domain [Trypanosoma melophagium]|uniref:GHMP kinase N-terminal domain n=1 Tax=Trypanosoma melophagium TaxID=715481 RepID=UPI00351A8ECB|nr:GHMP kinase N-terminal domain [Trypanosoma melophagium]